MTAPGNLNDHINTCAGDLIAIGVAPEIFLRDNLFCRNNDLCGAVSGKMVEHQTAVDPDRSFLARVLDVADEDVPFIAGWSCVPRP